MLCVLVWADREKNDQLRSTFRVAAGLLLGAQPGQHGSCPVCLVDYSACARNMLLREVCRECCILPTPSFHVWFLLLAHPRAPHGRQAGLSPTTDGVFIEASAARPDGSVVFTGSTTGGWYGNLSRTNATYEFIAVALDEDGEELWRWQVRLHIRALTCYNGNSTSSCCCSCRGSQK